MIALAIALLLMQQPYSTYWNDEPVALPSTAAWEGGPLDVPAVQEWRTRQVCNGIMFREGGCSSYVTEGYAAWSCADKSRVLLTSEDGVRHCIKF